MLVASVTDDTAKDRLSTSNVTRHVTPPLPILLNKRATAAPTLVNSSQRLTCVMLATEASDSTSGFA